eukprot:872599-Amphidinium_carterae.1
MPDTAQQVDNASEAKCDQISRTRDTSPCDSKYNIQSQRSAETRSTSLCWTPETVAEALREARHAPGKGRLGTFTTGTGADDTLIDFPALGGFQERPEPEATPGQ